MPLNNKPTIPPAAEPVYGKSFDPWNSVSTGHQRAETSGPQGWRNSRNTKLHSQFVSGHTGGKRVFDSVGAGSPDFDEKLGMLVPKAMRTRAVNSVADMLKHPGAMRPLMPTPGRANLPMYLERKPTGKDYGSLVTPVAEEALAAERKSEGDPTEALESQDRKIFSGLVVYVNGSTHPVVSDHKLKRLLAENGARMSLHLGRRQVTHVIVGKPAGRGGGAGGSLAAGKLDKEIKRVGGCGIKYVGVEWVMESIKAGKRLPEARFAPLKVASKGQQSVFGAFSAAS